MRYGVIPENLLERAILASGRAPTSMIDGYSPAFAEALVVATEKGVFDALAAGSRSAADVASTCGTDPRATAKLLHLLVGMRYLKVRNGEYALARHVRRWLLADRRGSARDAVLMKRLEWRWLDRMGEFVQDGHGLDVHEGMTAEDWDVYQRGMRATAGLLAPLLVRAIPVPKGARTMLDIGGSHGYYSVVLCRRNRGLRATVFDLPSAVEHAAPLLAKEEMGDRVVHHAGDALTDDLGESAYDLILMFGLVHHFDDETNRTLVAKAARALRPGGAMVIGEPLRPEHAGRGDQLGTLYDIFFALANEAGAWTTYEMAAWQHAAGLVPRKPIRPRLAPRFGLQVADRPSHEI